VPYSHINSQAISVHTDGKLITQLLSFPDFNIASLPQPFISLFCIPTAALRSPVSLPVKCSLMMPLYF
jgi:hypothetical protein